MINNGLMKGFKPKYQVALVGLRLFTGVKHQLRVTLASFFKGIDSLPFLPFTNNKFAFSSSTRRHIWRGER